MGEGHYPGVYLLLAHKDRDVRSLALKAVESYSRISSDAFHRVKFIIEYIVSLVPCVKENGEVLIGESEGLEKWVHLMDARPSELLFSVCVILEKIDMSDLRAVREELKDMGSCFEILISSLTYSDASLLCTIRALVFFLQVLGQEFWCDIEERVEDVYVGVFENDYFTSVMQAKNVSFGGDLDERAKDTVEILLSWVSPYFYSLFPTCCPSVFNRVIYFVCNDIHNRSCISFIRNSSIDVTLKLISAVYSRGYGVYVQDSIGARGRKLVGVLNSSEGKTKSPFRERAVQCCSTIILSDCIFARSLVCPESSQNLLSDHEPAISHVVWHEVLSQSEPHLLPFELQKAIFTGGFLFGEIS